MDTTRPADASNSVTPAFMGIIMLDTCFPRPEGDIGNPASFAFPTRREIVPNASPDAITGSGREPFLDAFLSAALKLEAEGATLMTTSCGFLAPFQSSLEQKLAIPVLTSGLFLHDDFARRSKTGRIGILTISKERLNPTVLQSAGIPASIPIGAPDPEGHFASAILQNRPELDPARAEAELVEAAQRLVEKDARIGGILLECTNMPPHAAAIGKATGLPVISINDGLNALWRDIASEAR